MEDNRLRCPKCGCNDLRQTPGRCLWGMPGFDCLCNHCGTVFQVEDPEAAVSVEYAVPFVAVRCPHCGSTDTAIASTRRQAGVPTIRFHRCRSRDCEKPFKSTERIT